MLLKTFLKKPFYIWSINNKNIPIVIRKIDTLNIKKKYDFYIYETIDLNRKSYFIPVGVFVSAVIIIFLFFKKRGKKQIILSDESVWIDRFLKSSNRNDFEFLYKNRNEWAEKFKDMELERDEFFNILNKHQYRSYWTEDMKLEVSNSFSKVVDKIKL